MSEERINNTAVSTEDSAGLPMTAKWDPVKLKQEEDALDELSRRPFIGKVGGYLKRTGPGLLQSAMTLGAGSAAASVLAGASFGYKLLWVQPLAMFLGICMLAALSNVVLTHKESPYRAFGQRIGFFLVFLWALGTILSSVIWHFPQYGLAAGAARDLVVMTGTVTDAKILEMPSNEDGTRIFYLNGCPEILTPLKKDATEEEKNAYNAKLENEKENAKELAEKKKARIMEENSFEFKGADIKIISDSNLWKEAVKSQKESNIEPQTWYTSSGLCASWCTGFIILLINICTVWSYGGSRAGIKVYEWFLRATIALVILSFGIVVFSNFTALGQDWVKIIRGFCGLDAWDILKNSDNMVLVMGMLGAAVGINMTFLYPYSILAKGWGPHHKTLAKWDLGVSMFIPFTLVTSLIMIAMTVGGVYQGDTLRSGLQPLQASRVLVDVLGNPGRIIFDLGLLGMTCGAVSTHMVVCGFTIPQMFGLKYSKWMFRICALLPCVGMLGVITSLPFWFPVVASAICFTMLPVAYLIFVIMNNMRSYIGDAVGSGMKRVIFNVILIFALLFTIIGSGIAVKQRVIDVLREKLNKPEAVPQAPIQNSAETALPADVTPSADTALPADVAPSADTALPADVTPPADTAPSTDVTPSAETAPSADVTPSADTAPSADVTPSADTALPADVAPSADTAPSADVAPSADTTPSADVTPSAE